LICEYLPIEEDVVVGETHADEEVFEDGLQVGIIGAVCESKRLYVIEIHLELI